MKNLLNLNKINNKILEKSFRGFTLVETMIGLTLFTFVTFVAISALFSMQTLNVKMKSIKNIYDSMYLVVDDITRELKDGASYEGVNISESRSQTCALTSLGSDAFNCVSFDYMENKQLSMHGYYFDEDRGTIYKYKKSLITGGVVEKQRIVKDDIKVTKLIFKIVGTKTYYGGDDTQQPIVKIIIKGETRNLPTIPFYIESIVSQRSPAS
jgi:type II secretory pathway pseudopilin PulG